MNQNKAYTIGAIVSFAIVIIILALDIVPEGKASVVLRLGKYNRTNAPGLHFVFPLLESAKRYSVKTERVQEDTQSSSKDLQDVSSTIVIQYNLKRDYLEELHKNLGKSYEYKVILPAIQESSKSSMAQFNASEIITKRTEVKDLVLNGLKERLGSLGINVSNVDLVNFSFSASFNEAIEEKVRAEQEALKEKNQLEKIRFQSEQKIVQAKAEAEKIRLESEALKNNPQLIEKIKAEAQLEAVRKWDGVLPKQMIPNGAVPFLRVNQ